MFSYLVVEINTPEIDMAKIACEFNIFLKGINVLF